MRELTVLFDAECALCVRARRFMASEPAYVPTVFLAAGSELARLRFPQLSARQTLSELTVVADGRLVFGGAKAWIVCLWSLRRYRNLALRLATTAALPMARAAFDRLSQNRHAMCALFGKAVSRGLNDARLP